MKILPIKHINNEISIIQKSKIKQLFFSVLQEKCIAMNRWYQVACVALLASLLVVPEAMAASVERTVIPVENTTYRVILHLPDEMVAGISESIPAGYEVGDISVPPGQFRIDGNTLYIAILGERNVSYLLKGQENPEKAIRGSWTDIATGERGGISAPGESGSPAGGDQQKDTGSPVKKAGLNLILPFVAAMAAILGAWKRREGRNGSP